jgi:hypothetical protein
MLKQAAEIGGKKQLFHRVLAFFADLGDTYYRKYTEIKKGNHRN